MASRDHKYPDGRGSFSLRNYRATTLLPIALVLSFLTAFSLRRAFHLDTAIENSRVSPLPVSAIIVTLLALVPFAIAGCGGASTIATAPITSTPTSDSQTYTITVTPTAATSDNFPVPSVQPINLTLVVN